MDNVQQEKREDRSEDEKCTSRKRPNSIKSEGIKLSDIKTDCVAKSNSTKKEDVQKISFPHTDDFLKIDVVDKPSGKELPALVEGNSTDCLLSNVSTTSKEEIQLNFKIIYPDRTRKRTEIFSPIPFSYDMQTFPRGKLIIINVEKIKKSSGMLNYTCKETDRDANRLQQLFLDLGFIIHRYDNPTTHEIKKFMSAAADDDYSELNCFACALLSSVEKGKIWGTNGSININDLTSLFCTKKLARKPKLFFILAYQMLKHMESYDSVDGPEDASLDLPIESDFLFCYSTVKEDYAQNHSESGSLFMEILINVFRSHAHQMDIVRMLTLVNLHIAQRKSQTDTVATNENHKIVSIISQLRQRLFFFPPYGPLLSEHCQSS